MPTTSRGYPYPVPTIAPDVPYDMQQLAEALNADLTAVTSGTYADVTLGAGWVNQDPNTPFQVSRCGSLVVLTGRILRSSGTGTNFGTVPVGFRPVYPAHMDIMARNGSTQAAGPSGHVYVNSADGVINFQVVDAAAITNAHWFPINMSWRAA